MPVVIPWKYKSPFQQLVDSLTQPKLDQSVPVATMKGGLAGMIEGIESLLPTNPVEALMPSPMMAGGRAAKGLVKGIKGFLLPDNKVAVPDVAGTTRILEGDQAMRALKKMEPKSIADIPSVRSANQLGDVSNPIPDSLDTNMAPGAPIIADTKVNSGRTAAIKRAKLTADQVWKIRELHDRGWKNSDIMDYTGVDATTVSEVKKRLSYGWVPEAPVRK